ncbi:hypothetical protein [Mycetocola manganoxydans]|uniref:hypothetical protein n=1 Tax=Mycetocola manganoxydans TaxID=699879 RepID=UPI001604713C|nr:hypothetical protein [Mycetocola manganoxydans]
MELTIGKFCRIVYASTANFDITSGRFCVMNRQILHDEPADSAHYQLRPVS